jgi:hypothetical protein
VHSDEGFIMNALSTTAISTGTDPEGWREYWRVHGASWRSFCILKSLTACGLLRRRGVYRHE